MTPAAEARGLARWREEWPTMPQRIQRRRRKGWRLPDHAASVTRPGRWGNPFRIGQDGDRAQVLARFETYARARLAKEPGWLAPLRGKDLRAGVHRAKPVMRIFSCDSRMSSPKRKERSA
jgi:Domain of unknown function (DUF4326)